MRKFENFGTLEKINGRLKAKSNHILEASIYLSLNGYIYSYHLNNESIEYIIAGENIERIKGKVTGRGEKVNIRKLISMFNYLVDFENSLLQGVRR
jgi:hypothetical protein